MQSILLNNYNAGAAAGVAGVATAGAAGAAGAATAGAAGAGAAASVAAGGMSRHTEYGITNNEWVCINDVPLSVYLDSLGIEACDGNAGNFQRMAMLRYMGVRGDFYLRTKVYRHLYVGGGYKCNLDPWNREFPMFPGRTVKSLMSGYKMTLYEYECFHSSLWGNADNVLNVIVLSTSVCGNRVYCVDVLH